MRKTRKDKKIEFYLTFIIFNYLFNIYIYRKCAINPSKTEKRTRKLIF